MADIQELHPELNKTVRAIKGIRSLEDAQAHPDTAQPRLDLFILLVPILAVTYAVGIVLVILYGWF